MSDDINPYADKTPKRSRDWCFTIWLHNVEGDLIDPVDWELGKEEFVPLQPNIPLAKYLVYQYEIGGKQQHLHIQGYVEFPNALSMLGAKKKLAKWSGEANPSMHKRRGTPFEAAEYCRKSETKVTETFESGEAPIEDEDPPMVKAMKDYMEKGPSKELLYKYPTYMSIYANKWKSLKEDIRNPDWERDETSEYRKLVVNVVWGSTNTGKSRLSRQEKPYFVVDTYSPHKFTEYKGQKIIVLDDFRGEIPFGQLLRLLDGYNDMTVNIMYKGNKDWLAEKVWITSNIPPMKWYKNLDEESISALYRRFTTIMSVEKPIFEDIPGYDPRYKPIYTKGAPDVEPLIVVPNLTYPVLLSDQFEED